eukprot:584758-Amphidinium_carterae.1
MQMLANMNHAANKFRNISNLMVYNIRCVVQHLPGDGPVAEKRPRSCHQRSSGSRSRLLETYCLRAHA